MSEHTLTIRQIINMGYDIFDFEYPLFSESYKETFQRLFIDYFFLDEIGFQTVEEFKLRLKTKLNLILPTYNKIYETQELEQRILDNYDITETYTRDVTGENEGNVKSTNKNLYKDAPKTKIDVEKFDIVTNLTKNEGDTTQNNRNNMSENWTRKMQGNIGVATDADAIISYWKSLRNVTLEIFENELTSLFMGVF